RGRIQVSKVPKHLALRVLELYFQPLHQEFQPRTMWSFSNAFTSAFKDLDPIPQYKATVKLAGFLQSVRPSWGPPEILAYGPWVVARCLSTLDYSRCKSNHY